MKSAGFALMGIPIICLKTLFSNFMQQLLMGDLIELFNPFMHNVVKWPNIMYETVKEDLVKMKDFLVDLLTRLAPNLSALVTSSFFNLKQKSISSFKMCNNLS